MRVTKYLSAFFTFVLLQGCQFDLSPWETDVDCPNMSIEQNIMWLQTIEQQGYKAEFKAAVIGDPQQYPGDLEETIKTINQRQDIDFVLLLGDLVETGIEKEYEWACKALNKTKKPIISVIGNHDSLSYGKSIWQDVFGPFDFSFSYQGVKFIGYNDNKYEFENVPDRNWLAKQAQIQEGENRRYTIGMSHIQPWKNDISLSGFLKQSGYDHMLHAHNHKFSYWQLASVGLPHFVTADTREKKFAVMTVNDNGIVLEQCQQTCEVAQLQNR